MLSSFQRLVFLKAIGMTVGGKVGDSNSFFVPLEGSVDQYKRKRLVQRKVFEPLENLSGLKSGPH